jgi:molybdate transport system substrate-binding protein
MATGLASRLLGLLLMLMPATAAAQNGTVIAAAASLRPAMDEIVAAFRQEAKTGPIEIVYGASGNLARQVIAGAPFQLFLAADEATVAQVHAAGRSVDAGRVFALGRLVLAAPRNSPVPLDERLGGLQAALESGAVRRIAIATPQLAPYGLAAQQTLEKTGLWPAARARLAFGENVAQAAQFVVSGAAEIGFAAQSTMLAPALAERLRWVVVDASLHAPILHRMVLVQGAGDAARGLYAFTTGATAQAILGRSGLDAPAAR